MVDVTKISIGDEVTIRARVTSLENGLIYIGLDNEEISILGTEIISHEPRSLAQRLAGLTVEQIEAAHARKDSALSEAFETAGTHIARARRDAGDLKRRPKNTGTGEADATPSPQVAGEVLIGASVNDTFAVEPGQDNKSTTETAAAAPVHAPNKPSVVLAVAHANAAEGRQVFNAWFRHGLTEAERAGLDGHIAKLLAEADKADVAKEAELTAHGI